MFNKTTFHLFTVTLLAAIVLIAPEASAALSEQVQKVETLFVESIGKTGIIVGSIVMIIYSIFTGKLQQALTLFGIVFLCGFIINWIQSGGYLDFFKTVS